MRSRAQGCDHSCAAPVRAVNAIAASAKMIDAGASGFPRLGPAEEILLAITCGRQEFLCRYTNSWKKTDLGRVEKFCLRIESLETLEMEVSSR